MSREKQIEEMIERVRMNTEACQTCTLYKERLCDYNCELCEDIQVACETLYNAGYRKQSEGEWKLHKDGSGTCSECHFIQKDIWDYDHYQHFCGHCGAKMKGGAE